MDIDGLKQAAIDAYMRSEGYSVKDDHYWDYGIGFTSYVNRDGTGTTTYAGTGYGPPPTTDIDYTDEWATIRSNIDTALEPWQEDRLPTPSGLNSRMLAAQAAVTALNIGNANSFGGALGGYLKTISDNAPLFRGAAMNAYNNSFVHQLPAAIANHGCLAAVVAEAFAAEKEIWTKAREDRDTHVEKATAAFDSYARSGGDPEIAFVLKLTGAAIAGASAIASGGVTLPFALGTAGITALSATNDYVGELEVARSGDSFESLMGAFTGGLDDIDDGIEKQEILVKEGLENAWKVFDGNRPLFDLTPRVSDDGDGKWGDETSLFSVTDAGALEIVLPSQDVIDSLSSGMTNLAFGLEAAEPKVIAGADDQGLLASSARDVGLRYDGVSTWAYYVGELSNASSLRDLIWDVRSGNQMFEAVIRDFRDADAGSQSNLDRQRERLAGGSGENAFDAVEEDIEQREEQRDRILELIDELLDAIF